MDAGPADQRQNSTNYSRDLTKMARDGKAQPGDRKRAQEIGAIEVLARRRRVAGADRRENRFGEPPSDRRRERVVAVKCRDLARQSTVGTQHQRHGGGAKYRGEFEARAKRMLKGDRAPVK